MFRLCVLFFAVACVGAKVRVGKAFFCRDPDTGKLHQANTTWPSTTFCGNYHCRLRRKNLTGLEYPIRQINITNVTIKTELPKVKEVINKLEKKLNLKNNVVDVIGINNLMKNDINNIAHESSKEVTPKTSEDDRFLTEKEIEAISKMLHTVKKSDLDAIIDIYNLAQDIYKEVDQTSPENEIDETVHDIKQDIAEAKTAKLLKPGEEQHVSYWYEPIAAGKIRETNTEKNDMATLPSNIVVVTTPQPVPTTTTTQTPNTNFYKTLTTKDFVKLPYYYPISNFQQMSPYTLLPKISHPSPTYNSGPRINDDSKYRKDIKPSVYLPYPFSFVPHYYNWSFPHTILYNRKHVEIQEEFQNTDKIKLPLVNAVLINPDLENHQDLFKALDTKTEKNKGEKRLQFMPPKTEEEKNKPVKPEWQTDPIAKHILEDARAHMEKTRFLKPFPLRKRIKLERVGKVYKLDEIDSRKKRNTEDFKEPELYEVFIERTTCQADYTVPGFFKHGNASQPYPECCPQRIL